MIADPHFSPAQVRGIGGKCSRPTHEAKKPELPGIATLMDGAKFDQLARALSTVHTRRRMMAIFGAAAGMMGQRSARGAQVGAATCGEEGAVCTLVFGCCDGLSCVTSAINTSYGICVPGDGGMVSTGTTLISPFSDTAVEEVTALMPATSSAPTTDPQAEREAQIQSRKSANAPTGGRDWTPSGVLSSSAGKMA